MRKRLLVILGITMGVLVLCVLSGLTGFKERQTIPKEMQKREYGTWFWTSLFKVTPEYRDTVLRTAQENGITSIYVAIDPYIYIMRLTDEEDRKRYTELFSTSLEEFIRHAHTYGIVVDAVAGQPNWVEDRNSDMYRIAVEYVKTFNETHEVKLRGLQFDIEPYVLDLYQENKKSILVRYLDIIKDTTEILKDTDIEFSVAIPEFYDGKSAGSPQFFFDWHYGYTFEHLIHILKNKPNSKILVMAYRTKSLGDDGTIDIAKDEIFQANRSHVQIIVAQEVGDVESSHISFYGMSKEYYKEQLSIIDDVFGGEKSYAGKAVHYIDALRELKD